MLHLVEREIACLCASSSLSSKPPDSGGRWMELFCVGRSKVFLTARSKKGTIIDYMELVHYIGLQSITG